MNAADLFYRSSPEKIKFRLQSLERLIPESETKIADEQKHLLKLAKERQELRRLLESQQFAAVESQEP